MYYLCTIFLCTFFFISHSYARYTVYQWYSFIHHRFSTNYLGNMPLKFPSSPHWFSRCGTTLTITKHLIYHQLITMKTNFPMIFNESWLKEYIPNKYWKLHKWSSQAQLIRWKVMSWIFDYMPSVQNKMIDIKTAAPKILAWFFDRNIFNRPVLCHQ